MTYPRLTGIVLDSRDSRGSGKMACHTRSTDNFSRPPLNPESQNPVNLAVSHYLYNNIHSSLQYDVY